MKTKTRLIHAGLIVLLTGAIIAVNTSFASNIDEVEETIYGTVVAVDWDDEDEVTAIAVRVATMVEESEDGEDTEIDEDYLIADTDKGEELWNHLGESVEVTGIVVNTDDGKTIKVTSYKVIGSEPEEN